MRVYFYSADDKDDGEHLGAWYTDIERGNFPQVPRVGDIVWLETREIRLKKFLVKEVHWSFKNAPILSETPIPSVGAEVYVDALDGDSQ